MQQRGKTEQFYRLTSEDVYHMLIGYLFAMGGWHKKIEEIQATLPKD